MNLPIITAMLGAGLLILQIILMLTTGLYRARISQFIGEGTDPNMIRVIRRHANLAENAGLFVAVFAVAEILGLFPTLLGTLALIFFIARISHALAFTSLAGSHGPSEGSKLFAGLRVIGAFGTAATGLVLGGAILFQMLMG